jgi:hypothetical protein
MLRKTENELATIEYVRKHTSIPVPQIYYVNHNGNHVVGAPFVLMEFLEGQKLCDVWKELNLKHKLSAIGQLAHILGQLAELKFDAIGSLKSDGTVGPLINMTEESDTLDDEPFTSTRDYFFSFLKDQHPARTLAAKKHYPAIREELTSFFDQNAENPTLNAPYRLIHNDLASQNILVVQGDKTAPPKITGIIDWDWNYTGPLYYLCEYPDNICDSYDAPEDFADNKVLRKHLVASLIEHFPENSIERKQIKQCFREKSYALNTFQGTFMTRVWTESLEGRLTEQYLGNLRGEYDEWMRLPYDGVMNWERDSDLTDSDAEESESQRDEETACEDSDEDDNQYGDEQR